MIASKTMQEVADDPFLTKMYHTALSFDQYLDSTSANNITLKGILIDPAPNGVPITVNYDIGYIHRWTKKYDNLILWKLYNLMWYYKLHPEKAPKYTMMVTLTGSHDSPRYGDKKMPHMRYLDKFITSLKNYKKRIKKYLGTVDYLSILEPHPTSGFVHAHNLYFLDELPCPKLVDYLRHHWVETSKMGSTEHALDLEIKEARDFNDIKSMIAYPISYLGSSSIGAVSEWTKYDVVFNASIWRASFPESMGGLGQIIRTFNPSQSLSRIMNQPPDRDINYRHIQTSLTSMNLVMDEIILYKCENYDDMKALFKELGGDM